MCMARPVPATVWKWEQPGFDEKLTAEWWQVGELPLLEFSCKVKPDAAMKRRASCGDC